jgi:hypothetical protein
MGESNGERKGNGVDNEHIHGRQSGEPKWRSDPNREHHDPKVKNIKANASKTANQHEDCRAKNKRRPGWEPRRYRLPHQCEIATDQAKNAQPDHPHSKERQRGLLLLGHLHLQYGDPAYRQPEEFHPRSKVFRHNAGAQGAKYGGRAAAPDALTVASSSAFGPLEQLINVAISGFRYDWGGIDNCHITHRTRYIRSYIDPQLHRLQEAPP